MPAGASSFPENDVTNADMPGNQEPPMGDEPQMDDMPENMGGSNDMDSSMDNNEGGADDSTVDIINKLSDTDREAVRAYAESMLARDETENGGNEPDSMDNDPMADQGEPQGKMFETFKFSKKQMTEAAKLRKQ
jgi:hypothetical protein